VADDSPVPLPRRVPGSKRHVPDREQGARLVGPAALPEDVAQRIRVALDAMRSESALQEDAPRPGTPDRAEGPASLPQRIPGMSEGPEPPAAVGPADPGPAPDREPTAQERPDRQDRPEDGTGRRAKTSAREKNRPGRRTKSLGRRTKAPARAPELAPPHRPSPSHGPVPQMALIFPPEPAPEEATIRPLAPAAPERGPRARIIGWTILVLVLMFIALLVLLL